MNEIEFESYLKQFPEITSAINFGYTFFFHGKDQKTPFVSIANSDNEYDAVSNLNRNGIFRLNIGVSSETYRKLFPSDPTSIDYTQLNVFMPHPHYFAQKFICILNPTGTRLERTLSFIQEAYQIAKAKSEKKGLA